MILGNCEGTERYDFGRKQWVRSMKMLWPTLFSKK